MSFLGATRPNDALPTSGPGGGHGNALSLAFLRRRGAVLGFSLVAIIVIAAADLATGYELALSVLYVGPVVAATWAFGLPAGLSVSVLAALAWLGSDALAEHRYSHAIYRYWEGFIRLATFVAFAVIIDRLRRALALSDDRLIKVLEGLEGAICVIDPATGDILYSNRSFNAAFVGARRGECAQHLLESALGPVPAGGTGSELRIEARWFLVRGGWLTWTDGRSVLVVSATDVTARRDAEDLNREHEARLQSTARLVAVGEIASSIAHELNQPLAAIASYVNGAVRRLRTGKVDAEALSAALEKAGEQADRAGRIIRRVRDFVQARQSVLAAVDLNAVVSRAAAHVVEHGGLRTVLRLEPDLPPALADAMMIEQVVLNLVRNAWEAERDTGAAGQPIEVRTARHDAAQLAVTISDRGPGLSPEASQRLFEPFFTTKPDGMGLGLGICRSIVELHGGRLWATGRVGGGAEFHFTVHAAAAA